MFIQSRKKKKWKQEFPNHNALNISENKRSTMSGPNMEEVLLIYFTLNQITVKLIQEKY